MFPVILSVIPVSLNGENVFINAFLDLTELKEIEMQLRQAQKLEAIGTLAGGIAHDFNNILGGILGGLSLLAIHLGEAGENHRDIVEMKALGKRGADLTKRLLGFTRRGKYNVKPLNLGHIIGMTSTLYGHMRKDILIHHELAPDLQAVLMDHAQLEQVLLNLFINAGQAMPEGGKIHLTAVNALLEKDIPLPGAASSQFVKLVVADTGVGMDAATQARIFEPFFTTKEPGQGTGLGLASVYGIIKGHAGNITVTSAPGQGSSFTLYLPATDQTAEEEKAPAVEQHGSGTILVVDDEEMIIRFFTGALPRLGYRVLSALGGGQALEIMRRHGREISLVILDMNMPGLCGRQTYDALQEIAPGTKVLLASGYSLDEHAQKILAHGHTNFIQKPFDLAALSLKLQEIL